MRGSKIFFHRMGLPAPCSTLLLFPVLGPAVTRKITGRVWIRHTLRKLSSCITRQAFTWNPKANWERGRLNNTRCRELEADIKRMNRIWKQLKRIAQNRFGWRMMLGCLYSSTRVNRRKFVTSLLTLI